MNKKEVAEFLGVSTRIDAFVGNVLCVKSQDYPNSKVRFSF
jgi:hypothetical protein